nr:ATP synthase F0 subunit 6 [Glypthelmins quieta]
MFSSRFLVFYNYILSLVTGGFGDKVYFKIVFFLFVCFLLLRIPYLYGLMGFGVYLFFVIFPLFLSLFFARVGLSLSEFFSSFVPSGTPLWIAPFVCLAETLSYLVRPVVLLIRPFVNLTIGSLGGLVLGGMCLSSSWVIFALMLLFFYEVFVAAVHWFIVCNILSFSEDH